MTTALRAAPVRTIPAEASTLSPAGLIVLLMGAFLPILDFFIVNVALPTIDTDLHASAPVLELIVAGYGTAYALMLVIGGRLGDAIGRRRMFVSGMAGFTLASLVCGIAPNVDVLIAARIAQGMTAAAIVPQVLASFQATLEGQARARAIGLYAATGGLAAAVGQLLGGLLVSADIAGLGWRPIFLVNVPVGLVGIALAARVVPETRSPAPASVDVPGTALLGITLVSLLIPLTEGHALGWPVWTWLLLGLAPLAAAAAFTVERRSETAGRTPLIPPSLVGLPAMRLGLAMAVPFFMGFGAFMFVFAITVQDGLRQSALHAGVAITPMAVGFFLGALAVARLVTRYGRRVITVGLALQAVGLATLIPQLLGHWPHLDVLAMTPSLAVAGVGQSFALGGLFRTILADVPPRLAGIGSGVLVTVQQGSLALGVAALGTLFTALSATNMRTGFAVVVGIQVLIALIVGAASLRLPSPAATPPR